MLASASCPIMWTNMPRKRTWMLVTAATAYYLRSQPRTWLADALVTTFLSGKGCAWRYAGSIGRRVAADLSEGDGVLDICHGTGMLRRQRWCIAPLGAGCG